MLKTILIVFISCRCDHLVEGWTKSKVCDFIRSMFRRIWTELAELGNTASNMGDSRNRLIPDSTLSRVRGARTHDGGAKTEWLGVMDFALRTVSQIDTKLTGSET